MKPYMNLHGSAPETIKALRVPAKPTATTDSIAISMRSMGIGGWFVVAVLLTLFVGTVFVCYLGWTSAAGADVPASGYIALVIGVTCSLAVGFGLMALVFYSSRAGYDEPARLVQKDDAPSDRSMPR
ncbi:hypothetical protein SAMN05216330_105130 [Bradyrhizobium sp. Ghvi]|uniref:hypothetical protein n=1 Tax=Bradyrhizobium sp. Ghvi TaxID=1855319 RepID=UPI0008EDE2C6|nr:hypothetical protein [Bradyrhizobium sp. Ghvi]SFO95567.1 hypothetical protein SAMN05216330_105130 [Bradyrhizobium sp. Ghvi]